MMDKVSGGELLVTCMGQACGSLVTVTCWARSWHMNCVTATC